MNATAAGRLELRFLGPTTILRDGERLALPQSRKTRALLAYLALTGRAQRRSELCALLWELPDDPRAALRWSLTKLRPLLDDPDRTRIIADRETIALDTTDVAIDFLDIRSRCESGLDRMEIAELTQIEPELGRELLEDLELERQPDYEAWRAGLRADARDLHARVLDCLVGRLADRPADALLYARTLVALAPLDESVRLRLLALLLAAGRSREADEQFALAARILGDVDRGSAARFAAAWRALQAGAAAATHDGGDIETPAAAAGTPASWPLERKQITALCLRLAAETTADELVDPEQALKRLQPIWTRLSAAADRYGGTVTSIDDDSMIVLFGAPTAVEDHARRACLAAAEMAQTLAGFPTGQPRLAVGIHSGEMVVGSLGDEGSSRYGAVGPVVKVAARLSDLAGTEGILLSAEARRQAVDSIDVSPESTIALAPGRRIEVFRLTGLVPGERRWQSRAARGLTAFVGRETELGMLKQTALRVATARGEAVLLVGEPGVGKSRLVHEFHLSPALADWRVVEARADPYDVDAPLRPVITLVRALLGLDANGMSEAAVDTLRQRLIDIDHAFAAATPALSDLLGLPLAAAPEWRALAPRQRRQQTHDWVKALLARASRVAPILLVLEDIHWLDEESRALIDTLIDGLPAMRVLMVMTARPEFRHGWSDRMGFSMLRLRPLGASSAARFVSSLLGADPSLARIAERLVAQAEGNPFFLEEMVQALVETGVLEGRPGAYALAEPVEQLQLPTTLHSLLASRMDRLAPEAKQLLQIASVIGRDVQLDLLKRLAGWNEADIRDGLKTLQSAEFLYEAETLPEPVYAFRHALTREVAYRSLLRDRRRALHAALVATMEAVHAANIDEHVERLSHHAMAAELPGKAVVYLLRAGEKAARQAALGDALDYFDKGLALIPVLEPGHARDRRELDLLLAAAPCLLATSGYASPKAGRAYERARAICRRLGDDEHMFPTLYGLWVYHWNGGDLPTARDIAEDMLRRAYAADRHAWILMAHRGMGLTMTGLAKFGAAIEHLEKVRALYDVEGDRALTYAYAQNPLVAASGFLALDLIPLGFHERAAALVGEVLKFAGELRHPFSLAYAHFCAALIALMAGDPEACGRHGRAGIRIADEHGFPVFQAWSKVFIGASLCEGDSPSEGVDLVRGGIAEAEAAGMLVWRPVCLAVLARALRKTDATDAALDAIDEAIDRAEERGELYASADLYRHKGELLVNRDRGAGETWLNKALATAEQQEAPWWRLLAATSLAELHAAEGRARQGRDILSAALRALPEGKSARAARQAAARLERLKALAGAG